MKLIINIPEGCTLHDIDECFPHYIKQYELVNNTLQVWIKHHSDIIPELITLTLMGDGQKYRYTIVLGRGMVNAESTNPQIELQIVV